MDDDPDLVLPRVDVARAERVCEPPREEEAREEELREALREEPALLPRDVPDWLRLPALPVLPDDLLREDDEVFDLLLPDFLPEDEDRALREDDERVPEERDELLCVLLLDFWAMDYSPPSSAMRAHRPQDAS